MDRQSALVLSLIFLFLFSIIMYYGAHVTIWSSIVLGFFLSIILLNLFYPPSQLAYDEADFSLFLYAAFEIIGIIILAIYITQKTFADVRYIPCNKCK